MVQFAEHSIASQCLMTNPEGFFSAQAFDQLIR
jgi:hypothetical protein